MNWHSIDFDQAALFALRRPFLYGIDAFMPHHDPCPQREEQSACLIVMLLPKG